MKRFQTLFAALVFFAHIPLLAENDCLVIELKSGGLRYFQLAKKPIVTFNGDEININGQDFSTTFDKVKAFRFEPDTTDEVKSPEIQKEIKKTFRYVDGQTVILSGLTGNERFSVYSIDGKRVQPDIEYNTDNVAIGLGSLPKGYYIIHVDHQSYKIYKK